MIRVVLPGPLRELAGVGREVEVALGPPASTSGLLDAIEASYPVLRGTLRDPASGKRRPFVRFFAGDEDLSHDPDDAPLPDPVASGAVPFIVIGAIAGG